MSPEIELTFPVEPVAVQSARFFRAGNRIGSFQPERVTSFKQLIRLHALGQIPAGFLLLTGPLCMEADFIFPPKKSMRKKDLKCLEDGGIIYKTTKPDLTDNLMKGCCDALTGVIWRDDAQICMVHSRKRYGLSPGIHLVVKEIEQ